MSRLESAEELHNTDHPLREAQLGETMSFFACRRKSTWRLWRNSLTATIMGLLVVQIIMLSILHDYSKAAMTDIAAGDNPESLAEADETPEEESIEEDKGDYAELLIIEPRPLYKATPSDEIVWLAVGTSEHGFEDLELEVSVNSKPAKTIPVAEAPLNVKGEIELEDALLMDELDVQPFDVVAYTLGGHTMLDNKMSRIISPIQFIQVRPFTEDAMDSMMQGGQTPQIQQERRTVASLMELLHRQIGATRDTYTVMATWPSLAKREALQQIAAIADGQSKLARNTGEFLEIATEKLPDHVIERIVLAEQAMQGAIEYLDADYQDVSTARQQLVQAGQKQQEALAELVFAVKECIKKKVGPAVAPLNWPFSDDQQYIKPNLDRQENPELSLDEIIQQQCEILDQLAQREPFKVQGQSTSALSHLN